MEVREQHLAFTIDEASVLTQIVADFLRGNSDVDVDVEFQLRQLWAIIGDVSIAHLTYKMLSHGGGDVDELLLPVLEQQHETVGSPKDPVRIAALLQVGEFVVEHGSEFLVEPLTPGQE